MRGEKRTPKGIGGENDRSHHSLGLMAHGLSELAGKKRKEVTVFFDNKNNGAHQASFALLCFALLAQSSSSPHFFLVFRSISALRYTTPRHVKRK